MVDRNCPGHLPGTSCLANQSQIRTARTSGKADLKHNLLLRPILGKPFTAMRFKIRESSDWMHFHDVAVERCYGNGSLGESISKLSEKWMFSLFGSRNSTAFGTLEKVLPVMATSRVPSRTMPPANWSFSLR